MLRTLIAIWGLLGIFLLVGRALWRLSEIALDGILNYSLSPWQWIALCLWIIVNAYSEGYKGFQQKFSPRTVARSWHLAENPTIFRLILAPFYTMGFFHANRKTKITAYVVVILVTVLVMLVGRIDQPWRGMIDAGVVVGLGWGLLSILVIFLQSLKNGYEHLDPCLPQPNSDLTKASSRES